MRLPEDTQLGRLRIVDVYEYYDGPRLFTAANTADRTFLALSVEESAEESRWLFSPVSDRRLTSLLSGEIDLRSAYALAEDGYVYEVRISSVEDRALPIKAVDISPEDLPSPDEFLLAGLEPAAPEVVPVAGLHAAQSRRETLRLALSPRGIGGSEAPSRLVGQVLVGVQELVSAIGQAVEGSATARGRISPDILRATELRAVGSFAGSFGVELAAADLADLFGDSLMAQSLAALDSLLVAGPDEAGLAELLDELQARAASKYVALISLLADSGTEMTFDWGSVAAGRGSFRRLDSEYLSAVALALSLSDVSTKTTYTVTGVLIGLNTRTGSFEIEDRVQGVRIRGRADQGRFNKDDEFTINGVYRATIEETVDVSGVTGEETITRLLVELTDAASTALDGRPRDSS